MPADVIPIAFGRDLRTRRLLRPAFELAALDRELSRVEAERDLAFGQLASKTCRNKAYWLARVEDLDLEFNGLEARRNRLLGLPAVREAT